MSCEQIREQLGRLIPKLDVGSDDFIDAKKYKDWLERECPSSPQPLSHTATIARMNETVIGLTDEQKERAVRGPSKLAIARATALLQIYKRLSD